MSRNVGEVDRLLRIFVGLVLVLWVLIASGPTWAWIGIIPVATGLFNFCPAYRLLGINTCKTK
jgi:hypothetical protein